VLNNITNFFNLIKTGKVKTQLDASDLLAIGTRDLRFIGQYQPTMIKYSDLVAGLVGGSNGQVLFRDNNTFGGSNNLFWDKVNNRLGVGTTIPANTLDVNGDARVSGLIDSTNTFTSIGAFSTGIGLSKTTLNSSTSFSDLISIQGLARSLNNFAYRVYGVKGIGATDGSFGTQSIEILTGLQGAISVGNGNKTVTTAMSLFASAESIGTGNTITNYYGAYLQTPSGTTITNKWGLFQQDTTSKNYFGGNVLINTTTDAGFKLDVNGTARFNGNVSLATNLQLIFNVGYDTKIFANGNHNLTFSTAGGGGGIYQWIGNATIVYATLREGQFIIGSGSVNASAVLQADSTTRGFLPPRMTAAQRTAIASPAVGLMVYQTDGTEGLYIFRSTGWALNS